MELDLKTFLTTLDVITNDLYVNSVLPKMPTTRGPKPMLSDPEVLYLSLAAQWHAGVPWKTERGFVRYALEHMCGVLPNRSVDRRDLAVVTLII